MRKLARYIVFTMMEMAHGIGVVLRVKEQILLQGVRFQMI